MTATEKKGMKIGTAVALLGALGVLLGWVGGSFAKGQEYGELRKTVDQAVKSGDKRDERMDGIEDDIRAIRLEFRAGIDRVIDKLDERTIVAPSFRHSGAP